MRQLGIVYFISLAVLALLSGCGDASQDTGPHAASLHLTIAFPDFTRSEGVAAHPAVAKGDFTDVASARITVTNTDTGTVLEQVELAPDTEGVWSATVPASLPVGPLLEFSAQAFNDPIQQDQTTEIFRGTKTTALTGSSDTVNISMAAVDDGTAIVFPKISAVTRPAEILASSTARVTIYAAGTAGQDTSFDYEITSGGGLFTNVQTQASSDTALTGSLALNAGGFGEILLDFEPPAAVAEVYTHDVSVTNLQGNSTARSFTTNVVLLLTGADVTTTFAPIVQSLSGRRDGSDIVWTALATDDVDQPPDLAYIWSFDPSSATSAAFTVSDSNPGLMSGYNEDVSGSITLTVTDSDSESTVVTFQLPAGLFPDELEAQSSEGDGSNPVVLQFPAAFPYFGSVDTTASYYTVLGLTPTTTYTVSLTAMSDNGDLHITPPGFVGTPTCTSELLALEDETCSATADSAGAIYVRVMGVNALTNSGTRFYLGVQ